MITIFNGKMRRLGQGGSAAVYAQIDLEMRNYLHLLKGARLAILLAIALHADEDGWAWPSYSTLQRETGYSIHAIQDALEYLCKLEINDQRVLLRYQPVGEEGRFQSNRYLIFPSSEEITQYEGQGITHLGAATGGGFDRRAKTARRSLPSCSFCVTEKLHDEQEPCSLTRTMNQDEEGDEHKKIEQMLKKYGVFPQPAQEIAAALFARGLSPEEAEQEFLDVLRASGGDTGKTVYRLRQEWDPSAPARAQTAARRQRYAQYALPVNQHAPPTAPDDPNGLLWKQVLNELQLEMTRATFDTWLRDTRLVACVDGTFVVEVPSTYAREWLEASLRPLIMRVLAAVSGQEVRQVEFVTPEASDA